MKKLIIKVVLLSFCLIIIGASNSYTQESELTYEERIKLAMETEKNSEEVFKIISKEMITYDDLIMIEHLVTTEGANVNYVNEERYTPLLFLFHHIVYSKKEQDQQVRAIELLLDLGADPDFESDPFNNTNTSVYDGLFNASRRGMFLHNDNDEILIDALIDNGADIDKLFKVAKRLECKEMVKDAQKRQKRRNN